MTALRVRVLAICCLVLGILVAGMPAQPGWASESDTEQRVADLLTEAKEAASGGNTGDAIDLKTRALRIAKAELGTNTQLITAVTASLADDYRKERNLQRAEAPYRDAVQIWRHVPVYNDYAAYAYERYANLLISRFHAMVQITRYARLLKSAFTPRQKAFVAAVIASAAEDWGGDRDIALEVFETAVKRVPREERRLWFWHLACEHAVRSRSSDHIQVYCWRSMSMTEETSPHDSLERVRMLLLDGRHQILRGYPDDAIAPLRSAATILSRRNQHRAAGSPSPAPERDIELEIEVQWTVARVHGIGERHERAREMLEGVWRNFAPPSVEGRALRLFAFYDLVLTDSVENPGFLRGQASWPSGALGDCRAPQAVAGAGIGISLARLRRFWAVAARRNSSRAP